MSIVPLSQFSSLTNLRDYLKNQRRKSRKYLIFSKTDFFNNVLLSSILDYIIGSDMGQLGIFL